MKKKKKILPSSQLLAKEIIDPRYKRFETFDLRVPKKKKNPLFKSNKNKSEYI